MAAKTIPGTLLNTLDYLCNSDSKVLKSWSCYEDSNGCVTLNVKFVLCEESQDESDLCSSSNYVGFKRKSLKQHNRDLERSKIWKQNKLVSQKDSISQTDIIVDSKQNENSHLEHVDHDSHTCTSTPRFKSLYWWIENFNFSSSYANQQSVTAEQS